MNVMGPLVDAWYELLDISVPVYRVSAPEREKGNYVILRAESETGQNNKQYFNTDCVVIVDIITRFHNAIDTSVVDSIDGEISSLILTTPGRHNLSEASGLQILNVKKETANYLEEDDGKNRYYRKISRYTHRVHETES
jgi:hypothetical protein